MNGPAWLWLLFISWCLHDLEEVLLLPRFDVKNNAAIKQIVEKFAVAKYMLQKVAGSRMEFNVAVSIMALLMLISTIAGYLDPHGAGMLIYGTMLGGYFLHVFTHVGGGIMLRQYTPGVITAIVIVLPSSIFIYWNLFNLGLLDWSQAVWTALAGIVIFIPLLLLVHHAAKSLSTKFTSC